MAGIVTLSINKSSIRHGEVLRITGSNFGSNVPTELTFFSQTSNLAADQRHFSAPNANSVGKVDFNFTVNSDIPTGKYKVGMTWLSGTTQHGSTQPAIQVLAKSDSGYETGGGGDNGLPDGVGGGGKDENETSTWDVVKSATKPLVPFAIGVGALAAIVITVKAIRS